MAHGKTLELRKQATEWFWKRFNRARENPQPRLTVVRDRSLRGKARIRARKTANKASRRG